MDKITTNDDAKKADAPTPIKPSPPQLKTNGIKYIAGALTVVLVGTGGFFAGTHYAKTTSANTRGGMGSQNGMANGSMEQMGNIGTVTAVSSTSITVSVMQGGPGRQGNSSSTDSTKTYTINSATSITDNGEAAAVSDIATGDRVIIEESDTDSSIAASISLNPSMRGGPQGQGGRMQSEELEDTSSSSSSNT